MANRDYKNVKRFVDGISKEVEETMAGGGTSGGKIYSAEVTWGQTWSYSSSMSFPCTDTSIQTFDDIVAWLKKNGYTGSYENALSFVSNSSVYTTEQRSGSGNATYPDCIWAATVSVKGGGEVDVICLSYVGSSFISDENSLFKENMPSDFAVAVSE